MRLSLLFALLLALPAFAQEVNLEPGTYQLTPTVDLELQPVEIEVPPAFRDVVPEGSVLHLPPGFSVSVYAAQPLRGPRFLEFSPDGVLYVANMGRDQIVAFPDRDKDGVADEAIVALDGLEEGHSLAFYKGALYVGEENQIIRAWDRDGDHVYEEREVFIDGIPWEGWHDTRTILFDEKNEKLYVSVGSPCDLCRQDPELQVVGNSDNIVPYSPERGTVLQFNADGTGRRIFATGVRNVIGMDLHPVTNELWGNNNHYDLHGPDLPPEWIDILRDNGFYGLPFTFGYQAWIDFTIPEYRKILPITQEDSLLVQTQQRPVALVPAHLAPMAIHFYTGERFPARFKNAAFVALRGGQVRGNLASVPGFKVVALFSEPDGSKARVADFLTGFGPPHASEAWGKPVGITSDSLGNLYVTSDHATWAVFKISHSPIIGTWEHNIPQQIVSGADLSVDLTVRLERLGDTGEPVVTANLSELGGPSELVLEKTGEQTYRLRTRLDVAVPHGAGRVRVLVRQGPHEYRLTHELTVLPGQDEIAFASAAEGGWALSHSSRVTPLPPATDLLYKDNPARGFAVTARGLAGWNMEFAPPEPLEIRGFKALRFAFHPGDMDPATGSNISLAINKSSSPVRSGPFNLLANSMNLPGVDLSLRDWQVVEIPAEILAMEGPIESIRFFGDVPGTFYLDDLRLVTAAEPEQTVVLEERTEGEPEDLALGQNYPNPFNSSTVIRFSLPRSTPVELAVYNMTGQKIATLVQGERPAGLYSVRWDGRDDNGAPLASGLYLYNLRAGERLETRKLLLLR